MNCESQQLLISKLIDNELDYNHSSDLFLHLSACPDCRQFLQSATRIRSGLWASSGLPKEALASKHLPWNAVKLPEAHSRGLRRSIWQKQISFPVAASIGALLLLGSLFVIDQYRQVPIPSQAPKPTYLLTLPTVEVVGFYADSSPKSEKRNQ